MPLTVTARRREPFLVISMAGELDHAAAARARAELLGVISEQSPPARLVLDLTAVAFMDSAGVNVLAGIRAAARSSAHTLHLVSPPDSRPRHVLRITGFDQFLPVADDLTQALSQNGEAGGKASECAWDTRIERLRARRETALAELEEAKAEAARALLAAQAEISHRLQAGTITLEAAAEQLERAGRRAVATINEAHRTAGMRIGEPQEP